MRGHSLPSSVAIASMAIAAMACVVQAAAPNTVLDETCYLRHYCQFGVNHYSPAALKAEGEAILGKADLDRFRRETEPSIQKKEMAPAPGDWRDHFGQPMWENFAPRPRPPRNSVSARRSPPDGPLR